MAISSAPASASAYRVEPGFEFEPIMLTVTRAEQTEKLGYSDIPLSLHGDKACVGFLARYPIKAIGAALFACHPDRGYVHAKHHIMQREAVMLDEPVHVTGRFTDVVDHPRGWMMHGRFEYRRGGPDGDVVLVVEPEALMADRARMSGAAPAKSSPAATGTNDASDPAFERLETKVCTPEKVLGYCGDTNNKIHTEPEYAKKFGLRAPITAGNQIVHYLLAAHATHGPGHVPDALDVDIRFRRPVFWDDTLSILGRREEGRLVELRAMKDRLAADLRVN